MLDFKEMVPCLDVSTQNKCFDSVHADFEANEVDFLNTVNYLLDENFGSKLCPVTCLAQASLNFFEDNKCNVIVFYPYSYDKLHEKMSNDLINKDSSYVPFSMST